MNDVTVYPMKIRISPNNTKNIDALLKKFIYLPGFPEIYWQYISSNLILRTPPVSQNVRILIWHLTFFVDIFYQPGHYLYKVTR